MSSINFNVDLQGPAPRLAAAVAAISNLLATYGLSGKVGISGELDILEHIVDEGEVDPWSMTVEDLLKGDDHVLARARTCLRCSKIVTVADLITRSEDDLMAITNFGTACLDRVVERLSALGLSLQEP